MISSVGMVIFIYIGLSGNSSVYNCRCVVDGSNTMAVMSIITNEYQLHICKREYIIICR